jgi:hypothetical protein
MVPAAGSTEAPGELLQIPMLDAAVVGSTSSDRGVVTNQDVPASSGARLQTG